MYNVCIYVLQSHAIAQADPDTDQLDNLPNLPQLISSLRQLSNIAGLRLLPCERHVVSLSRRPCNLPDQAQQRGTLHDKAL